MADELAFYKRLGRHSSSRMRTCEQGVFGLLESGNGLLAAHRRKVFEELRERITGFTNPSRDPSGSTYNITQATIAVGNPAISTRFSPPWQIPRDAQSSLA